MRFFVRFIGSVAMAVMIASCGGGGGDAGITGTTGGGGGTGGAGNNITCSGSTFCMGSDVFVPTSATVARNTEVSWQNNSGVTHNVIFSNSAAALSFGGGASGNITEYSSGTRSRTFATAGTFTFQCTLHPGMSGTLTVQ